MTKLDFATVGAEWLAGVVDSMVNSVEHLSPVEFIERFRYLPQGATQRPGPMRYDLFPYMREILNCFDPRSPVREVNLRKGAQIGYTTSILESVLLYYIAWVKTAPTMFLTADKEMAQDRIDNNILPMLRESGFSDLIRSADIENRRKTGKRKGLLQWDGGGSLVYNGAKNAAKMRAYAALLMLKDELDGWLRNIGKDGNSDSLTDARTMGFYPLRKIMRGSTPLTLPSMTQDAYLRGDQRQYNILCKACSFPQELKHRKPDDETGLARGFQWEIDDGTLVLESVRYCCADCGHEHFEADKEYIFAEENGAKWVPTARPKADDTRSYHLPAFYAPFGFRPWSKCISDFLESYDPVTKQTLSISKYQEYYNNTLGLPFEVPGSRIHFQAVSRHRRVEYKYGQVPNAYAVKHSGSRVLFLTCEVDVHKRFLAVAVFGWTTGARGYLVDYWQFERANEDDDCSESSSPVWARLADVIERSEYVADDGSKYTIALTLIDAGYANDTVSGFCAEYDAMVYPILGRDRPTKNQAIKEFDDFKTKAGGVGYKVVVDHYKDRLAPVLRRRWEPELGPQPEYHFNAPVDVTQKQLEELTKEYRVKEIDTKGNTGYSWHRPSGARNELWDLLVYGHASVEIFAWMICVGHFELEKIDWREFWEYAMDVGNDETFCRFA